VTAAAVAGDDRLEVDAALARRLVDTQFPYWADLPIGPVEWAGWDNRTYRLGERMKLRLPRAARYAMQVEKEARFLPGLAGSLPVRIPVPLATGRPAFGYPYPWSVQDWIEGEVASAVPIADPVAFARAVAGFLSALQAIGAEGGPEAGAHSFFRGGPLAVYDAETRAALGPLGGAFDTALVLAVWEAGLGAAWQGAPVWVHGDVAVGNLLVRDGRLVAVIDFGSMAVGDPACDLVLAWTFLDGAARDAFREAVAADEPMWARARGWALWKALITRGTGARAASRVIEAVLRDHREFG